jgi:hypothetical protein
VSQQESELVRVRHRIGVAICDALATRLALHRPEFFAEELRREVEARIGPKAAPGSADRILRDLRQRGVLDYVVLSRRRSHYRVVRVGPPPPAPPRQLELFLT